MRILSRYFLASYVTLFVTILIFAMMSILVIEMLVNFDEVFGHGQGFGAALAYLFLHLPSFYWENLIPVASFAAAFFCLGLPARRHEFTAIKAGGISPHRVAVPVLGAALILSGAALIVNETLVLGASREWSQFGRGDDLVEFQRGTFWYRRGDSIYNLREANRDNQMLIDVILFERGPDGRLKRSIRAERVLIIDDQHWAFQNATLRTFTPDVPTAAPKIERVAEFVLESDSEEDLALLGADAETLSLGNLSEFIEASAADGRDTRRYETLWHDRVSAPLTVLVFALLAIPLGLSVERTKSFAASGIRGVGVLLLYRVMRGVVGMLASLDSALVVISPWILLALFACYGAWSFARIPR